MKVWPLKEEGVQLEIVNVAEDGRCWLIIILVGALCPQLFSACTERVPDWKLGENSKLMFVPTLDPVVPTGVFQR